MCLPSGAKVEDLLTLLIKKYKGVIIQNIYQKDGRMSYINFWIDGKHADLETNLSNGNELLTISTIGRG